MSHICLAMSLAPSVLFVQNLSISFPKQDFEAVKDISFSLEKGKTLTIVGESGSGKSLIALSLMGLQPKDALIKGVINWQTEKKSVSILGIDNKAWQNIRGKDLGMIFQEPMTALNPLIMVGKQIEECIRLHQQCSRKKAKQLTLDWIAKVKLPLPSNIYKRYPHQLSGGQKQRIMIAMAMCNTPSILIADEATTALDATVQQEVVQLMKELQQESQTAMIFITHDLALAAYIADSIMVMQQGKLIELGSKTQILEQPSAPYTRALLACRPGSQHKGKALPIIDDYLQGNTQTADLPPKHFDPQNPLLRIQNLNVWYPEQQNLWGKTTEHFKAVQDVTFSISAGQTIGLVGESGCGKSTIGKALMGISPIHSGHIYYQEKDLAQYHGQQWNEARRHIQLIFQDPFASLNPRHSIADIITEPLKIHRAAERLNYAAEASRLLNLVQLPASAAKRYPHQFSGGQRQRIGIARALALNPRILIADESVSALDVSVQAQILNLLQALQHELSLAYLFISHDLSVVHYIADDILVMQAGKIVERGSADAIIQHPLNNYTQQLLAAMPTNNSQLSL